MKILLITSILLLFTIVINALTLQEIPDIEENEKIFYLSKIWKEVDYNYPFFNILEDFNWDRLYQDYLDLVKDTDSFYEYYRVIQKFVASLQDCNTRVVLPPAISNNLNYPLVRLDKVEGKIIVANIGERYAETVPIGSLLLEIDNVPADQYIKKEVAPYISASHESVLTHKSLLLAFLGEKGSKVQIKVEKPDGSLQETELTRDWQGDSWSEFMWQSELLHFNELDGKTIHLQINRFHDPEIHRRLDFMKERLQESNGIIIDLRHNNIGNVQITYDVLTYFTDVDKLPYANIKSPKYVPLYRAFGSGSAWYGIQPNPDYMEYAFKEAWIEEGITYFDNNPERDKILVPLVILIGEKTTAPAEDFAMVLRDVRDDVILIGTNTSGQRGQSLIHSLPGAGQLWISTSKDIDPQGNVISKFGIEPDIRIKQTYEDYLNDIDTVLKRGHDYLRNLNRE